MPAPSALTASCGSRSSLNTKYNPPFATEVLEAHPNRLYTFSQVAVGLKVTPTDTPVMPTGPTPVPEGMVDPIDNWNHDHGRATGPMNQRGYYPVTCPLEHEHTGKVDHGTDYKPGLPGVFKCQHEHRGHEPLTTTWYRAWILEQDPTPTSRSCPGPSWRAWDRSWQAPWDCACQLRLHTGPPSAVGEAGMQGDGPELKQALSKAAFLALQEQLARSGLFPDPPFDIRSAILADLIHVASEDCYWSIETQCLISYKVVDERWFSLMLPSGMLDRVNDAGKPLGPMSITKTSKPGHQARYAARGARDPQVGRTAHRG